MPAYVALPSTLNGIRPVHVDVLQVLAAGESELVSQDFEQCRTWLNRGFAILPVDVQRDLGRSADDPGWEGLSLPLLSVGGGGTRRRGDSGTLKEAATAELGPTASRHHF